MTCEECTGCRLGLCNEGAFGSSCNQTCNRSCRMLSCSQCQCEVCDQISGNCTNGCDTGWYGANCENVCPEKCDKATDLQDVCNHETGYCEYGCQTGFYGDTCNNTCYAGCKDLLCDNSNGTCLNGCISGYSGEFCGVSAEKGLDRDEVAGAIGGAFVITLWAGVVIVLICFLWRRRLKRLEIFHRNTSFENQTNRTSSRRPIGRTSSNSSLGADGVLYDKQDSGTILLTCNNHTLLQEKKSVQCMSTESEEQDRYIYSRSRVEQDECDQDLQSDVQEYYVHFTNEDGTAILPVRRASSECDLRDLSAIWKPSIF